MAKRKIAQGEIPADVMAEILRMLQKIRFGEVILTAQDGVLIQMEWSEKLRLDCWGDQWEKADWPPGTIRCVAGHIRQEFAHLQFGRLVIVVKQGNVLQMERTEKQRFTGMYGEGI
ncbi:MAG: YezD family protein [Selenomonas montiformis]|uniref:DUF2292 domain-containing protein n=1 Tax=Selenomonas montiformis TaxID=2652285 RepID=UPI002A8CDB0F|nr:YezD family protein [Selenomonas montiformis]